MLVCLPPVRRMPEMEHQLTSRLDPVLNVSGVYEAVEDAVSSARLEVFYTHVTVDEIAATPNLEKCQWLLKLLV